MADRSFLEWPFLEDGHRDLANEIESWAAAKIVPLVDEQNHEQDLDGSARRLVAMLAEGGWLRYVVPSAYGGAHENLDVRSICLCRETLSRASGLADFCFAMQGLGSAPISFFGSDVLKAAYLPKVASGQTIAAFALSEPDGGSDVASLKCAARKDGNDYVLDGTKTWISNAGIAGHYVVFARTGEAPGAKGLSAFVVDSDANGLTVTERIPVIAPHPLGTIVFDGCRVPADNMLGGPGEGFKVAMATLDVFRSTVGAAALGFARRALDESLTRAKERQVQGKPLAGYQLIQEKIADMALDVDAAALLVYRAAWTKDEKGTRVSRESGMAKLYATEAAQRAADQAVQIFGGLGVVSGNIAETLYREVRALRIYEGTSEIQKLVIANQTLKES